MKRPGLSVRQSALRTDGKGWWKEVGFGSAEAAAEIVVLVAVGRRMPPHFVVSKEAWTGNCIVMVAAAVAAAVVGCSHQSQHL